MEVGHAYATLGVAPGTSDAGLRTAYRAALRRNHPDVTRGADPRALASVRTAYRTLTAQRARDVALRRPTLRPTERHVDVYA